MLKGTPSWNMGRRGEILMFGTLAKFGLSLIDVSSSNNARAPLLHQYEASLVSPDALVFMASGVLFIEFKTKRHHEQWRGGSRSDILRIPPRTEEGIDRKNYEAYQQVERSTGRPVVLMITAIEEGEMIANTLRGLGEPRMSTHPDHPLVNWDVWKFRRICTFDRKRLGQYFFDANGVVKEAPVTMPSPPKLQQAVDWLRPQQGEFDLIMLDIFAQLGRDWTEE